MKKLVLNQIKLEPTKVGTRILYDYSAPKSLLEYIKGEPLFIEFPGDVSNVPQAILAIPFVGIMLTVAMLLDVEIHVPELDNVFCLVLGILNVHLLICIQIQESSVWFAVEK